jgi:acetyl esterase
MPLHPQAARFIDEWKRAAPKRVEHSEPREIRDNMRAGIMVDPVERPLATIEDASLPGDSGPIPARIYRPSTPMPHAAIVFYHGGGWVAGDLDTHDNACRAFAHRCNAAVISIDYRLAPEHRFPAAAEDAYAALQAVAAHAGSLGIDARRIHVMGDSAGGNLAAAVALMARDRRGYQPARQLLIYPVIAPDFDTRSYEEFAEGHLLTRSAMEWFWQQYAPGDRFDASPYAVPSRAASLAGLPPALVVTAEYDVLRDEGEAYARRLHDEGVTTALYRFDGWIHGFLHRIAIFDGANELVELVGHYLQHPPASRLP